MLKYLYTMIKWILSQVWNASSTLVNLLMYLHAKNQKTMMKEIKEF